MTIEITGNETLDELEEKLDQLEDTVVADGPPISVEEQSEVTSDSSECTVEERSDSDTDAASLTADQDDIVSNDEEADEPKKVIIAKDGVHTIPYDVLEAERREAERLRQQLAEMENKQVEYDNQARLLELRDKQLQKLGVDPDDLPENLKVSEQQIDELRENYPELAPFITTLIAKVDAVSTSVNAAHRSTLEPDPIMADIRANTDLNSWMEEKGDKWSLALDIDDRLLADPEWSSKSQPERFNEVVRRTKAAFGENIPEAKPVATNKEIQEGAADKEQAVTDSLPASPSLVGASNTHEGSVLQQAANMNNEQLQVLMAGMTADQIDALLEQIDF
ncbi:hypothetical protein IHC92_18235 [Photobacterium damselae subsp. damselae]|uniref:hypothetical protein n=1 Tax=Photobacterium damselae TaxID=38293 RepID=UPI001F44BFFF|nr:hypothetical protein [Photobacterium damselae]UKA08697.1 hypothetical protein IHC90_16950 [Photobacterium damselae subsp. damselae]UKA22909.1 hypothetical protein IHC92_18235 [Photobacterium damselae subsp. damselae]